jgi:DNA invertase Pin-like site-specific DNA recombinase
MKYVAYYRVSTQKQGISGLGLQAQKNAVERYISPELIDKEFTEVETGTRKKHRPILAEALELCKRYDATLIVAKLDRLTRNVNFLTSLMDSKVKFKAVDMPEANELTIHILAAIAQNETKVIRKRIVDALAVKKEEYAEFNKKYAAEIKAGTVVFKKLGGPKPITEEDRLKGQVAIKQRRRNNPNNKRAIAYVKVMKLTYTAPNGVERKYSLQALADQLNNLEFKTSQGKQFNPIQVSRLLKYR